MTKARDKSQKSDGRRLRFVMKRYSQKELLALCYGDPFLQGLARAAVLEIDRQMMEDLNATDKQNRH